MDSSAFQLLVLPACESVCLGLISGFVIHLTIEWTAILFDRSAPDPRSRRRGRSRPRPVAPSQARRLPALRELPRHLESRLVAKP